jgi:hypothetical protein
LEVEVRTWMSLCIGEWVEDVRQSVPGTFQWPTFS